MIKQAEAEFHRVKNAHFGSKQLHWTLDTELKASQDFTRNDYLLRLKLADMIELRCTANYATVSGGKPGGQL